MEHLLSERQAAESLGLSMKTLQAWRWKRRGPRFFKVGGAVRYRQADLEAFVAGAVVETRDSLRHKAI